jgi:predicted GIY-YIG superfamily endonuclease
MTSMKECRHCGKLKDTTQFSKCSSTKDKLQPKCKECNKNDNHKFRTQINPTHHKKWQDTNWDRFMEYLRKYRKADKTGIIYSITNPNGETYIGMSEMYFKCRIVEHKKHYKQFKQGKRESLPLLHESFDKYGMENHEFKVVKECIGLTRAQLKQLEDAYIIINKSQNISLNIK